MSVASSLMFRVVLNGLFCLILILSFDGTAGSASAAEKSQKAKPAAQPTGAAAVAVRYAEALASGDRVTVGQLDFACQYLLVSANGPAPLKSFPPSSDPSYAACWDQLMQTHRTAVEYREQGMDVLWPGKGSLVFFREQLNRYAASFFVMDLLGLSPPAGGLIVQALDSAKLPAASFRLRDDAPTVAAPATVVRMQVAYKDPLSSPVAYAPGSYKWANTIKRPRAALKAVTLKWVVLTGLKKLGFPGDAAVVNLTIDSPTGGAAGTPTVIPFVTETSSLVETSPLWWGPADQPGTLLAAVGRAALYPEMRDRLAMLNRVLIIDQVQPEALTLLTRDLYQTLLSAGAVEHKITIGDGELAQRFDELYWDTYAQTTRMDISLGMEVGGLSKPTPADYLYRLIPAMEMLAKVRPGDLENRLRLGIVYRWNNDQLAAIAAHEALLKEIPPERYIHRVRALIELAWSRIARVSWNRTFDDPGIIQAYKEAEEAYKFTDRPLDKFAAAYTMAYSLAFTPKRDNQAMLELLTDAQRWYLELAGASMDSWRYLLANDNLKGVIEADPVFKPLLASS
ncbi:MAG: hypothetical protein FJ249_01675 [Nitrospira sp.]|nr:hypothetical protein [Nitrospira sp.]